MSHRVLVIDDDAIVLKYIARALASERVEVETTISGRTGLQLLTERPFDAVICDLRMPELDGLQVLDYVKKLPDPPVFLMLTAYGNVSTAMDAVRRGADEFLEKPLDNLAELASRLGDLLGDRPGVAGVPTLVGGASLDQVRERIARFAHSQVPVLIQGEVGTGKSLVARAVWRAASRPAESFGVINCAAVSWNRPDRSPWSSGSSTRGVLVLDEVGELPDSWQVDLLQRLQQLESGMPVPGLPRLMATTSGHLAEAVRTGFRPQLLFRLNRHRIELPALRERRDDIPRLVAHFVERHAAKRSEAPKVVSAGAMSLLERYHWPGNVRQIENLISLLCVAIAEPRITREHVAAELADNMPATKEGGGGRPATVSEVLGDASSGPEAVRRYEAELLELAMAEAGGNQSEAARLLKMSRSTLSDKLRRLGLRDDESDDGAPER